MTFRPGQEESSDRSRGLSIYFLVLQRENKDGYNIRMLHLELYAEWIAYAILLNLAEPPGTHTA